MRTHIKKETKVGSTIFIGVLLFVGAIFRVLDVVVDRKNHLVENIKKKKYKLIIKNLQFLSNQTDTQGLLLTHKLIILTKFRKD